MFPAGQPEGCGCLRGSKERKNDKFLVVVGVSGRHISDILRRIAIKRPFASKRAEVIGLALVLRLSGCTFGIYAHSANRIFFHTQVGFTSVEWHYLAPIHKTGWRMLLVYKDHQAGGSVVKRAG